MCPGFTRPSSCEFWEDVTHEGCGSCSVCNESTDDGHYDSRKSKLYCTKCYDETQGAHQTHARRIPDALEEAA